MEHSSGIIRYFQVLHKLQVCDHKKSWSPKKKLVTKKKLSQQKKTTLGRCAKKRSCMSRCISIFAQCPKLFFGVTKFFFDKTFFSVKVFFGGGGNSAALENTG